MSDNKHADIEAMSFEQALAELETIVSKLEQGQIGLEDSIDAYERGAKLKEHCDAKLKDAQLKVDRIKLGPDGAVSSEPFDAAS
ncbi:MAG: exodeoxyribonuclease VII small subunit [Alphaproteobacteria bacterium]|nr:exodeoxyribonuclease VII small subunit [Alphaproteobacteria bacterium]MBU0797830.1 exodeoxyribonuclease VII small subunit [Alphaproteobacteria bacterium]MBU0886092.1 exodeoxyribonuclease VII small subunit [Alphaproteobacteria bacterium]MBU1814578.1 exodeoxyribonuclease VII small subunit [Alphaproteobacteria bacterium]MBU2089254.1 exodeoxyribonuclease VII small subunit [Alphaproteobacteria bacterium]